MRNKILNKKQVQLLNLLASSNLKNQIYWSGGTALSECYFKHRLSTDIDIFSENLIDDISLQIFIKNLKNNLKIKNIKHLNQLNRNLYDLDGLKLEIVYFPFASLESKKNYRDLKIDSLFDISANKTLALYQRNDPKDIFDLYFILKKTDLTLDKLIENVEKKFGEKLEKSLLSAKIEQNLRNLKILSPLVFDQTIFTKIQKYFSESNRKYLLSILL